MPDYQTQSTPVRAAVKRPRRGGATPGTRAFKDILCAIDGTRASEAAVRMAVELAGNNGSVTFLAVTSETGSGQYQMAAISPTRAKSVLAAATGVAEHAGAAASTVIDPAGPPAEVIIRHSHDHDLLVLGAPSTSRLSRLVIGSVMESALNRLDTPLLLVRTSFHGSLSGRQIVAASDGQSGSEHVVRVAGDLAREQNGHVTLLHAIDGQAPSRPRMVENEDRLLREIVPEQTQLLVRPGRASSVIVDVAHELHAAMIVMGTRRLHGLRALGSVSRHVAREAPCSVLLLPPR